MLGGRTVETVGIDRKIKSIVGPVVEERLGLRAGVKVGWRAGRVPIFGTRRTLDLEVQVVHYLLYETGVLYSTFWLEKGAKCSQIECKLVSIQVTLKKQGRIASAFTGNSFSNDTPTENSARTIFSREKGT